MDQVLLVDSRINAGDALMNALAAEGIEVTHACWAQAAGDEGLYLYLATRLDGSQLGELTVEWAYLYPAPQRNSP